MKKIKKIMCIFLAIAMLVTVFPVVLPASAETIVASGKVSNVIWKLNSDGVIVFSGDGPIDGYYQDNQPWRSYYSQIKKAVINEGVTSLCGGLFRDCTTLTTVIIPNTVNYIGSFAFYNCSSLTEIALPKNIEKIESYTFRDCTSLKTIYIPLALVHIDHWAFWNTSAETIYYEGNSTDWGNIQFGYFNHLTSGATKFYNYDVEAYADSLIEYEKIKNDEPVELAAKTEYNGHTYGIYAQKLSWDEAAVYCESQGGYLVTITSQGENDAVASLLSGTNKAYWIGAESYDDVWEWVTGEPWEYTNWGKDEPADFSETRLAARINCETSGFIESLYGLEFYTGDWDAVRHLTVSGHDIPMDGFICEWEYGNLDESEFDYHIENGNSSEYNPKLAKITAILSNAVYNESDIENAYYSLGFTEENFDVYDYDGDFNPYKSGHSIGIKKSENDNYTICLVVVRGSVGNLLSSDWIGNYSIATTDDDKHIGFAYPANYIYLNIKDLFEKKSITGEVKFVITGHSRGAAVANLLAVQLMESGVSSEDIYNYNFACPDVACKDVFPAYNNIFNLCNREDPVPFVPGNLASVFTTPGTSWGKFGKTYWFTKDAIGTINPFDDHDMDLYLEFFEQELNLTDWGYSYEDFKDDVYHYVNGWVAKVLCPVDVIITDIDGNRIASVIGDEINYYGSNFGEVVILTDGDKKIIYIADERNFDIELIGSDKGNMTYSIEKYNMFTGETFESKTFSEVELFAGKKMKSPVYQAETTEDIELFVIQNVNGTDIASHLVNSDGTETEIEHIYTQEVFNPTCIKRGYSIFTCSGCGNTYTDFYVEATGHCDNNLDNVCDVCDEQIINCEHICHSNNEFLQFIWKIYNFIMRLFSMEKYCSCGAAHY